MAATCEESRINAPADAARDPLGDTYVMTGTLEERIFSKILLIKKNNTQETILNVYAVNNQQEFPFINHLKIHNYLELLELDYQNFFGEMKIGVKQEALYLVCTNGKKDKCCSKFGLPIFNTLSFLNQNVWQCTHVGGDRFAPNILHLPYSHLYGHLNLNELDEFYATTSTNNIFISKYRGISCYNKSEQAAEFFLRNELKDFSFQGFKLMNHNEEVENRTLARFYCRSNDTYYDVMIKSKKSETTYFLTCKSTKEVPITIFELLSIHQASI